jgi:hypothetical protein
VPRVPPVSPGPGERGGAAAPGADRGVDRSWRDPVAGGFLAVVVVAAVQAATSGAGGSLRAAVPYAAAGGLAVLGRRCGVARDDARAVAWLTATAAVLTLLGASAIARFLWALPAGLGEPGGFYRVKVLVTTPLGDHNTAAGLLLVGVVTTVVLLERDRRWWAGVLLTSGGVVACLSRGAAAVLLAVGLLGMVVAVRRAVAARVAAAGAAVLALVTGLAVVLGAAPPPGAAEPEGPIGASVLGRLDLVARGFEVLGDHPWLGVGLGGFGGETTDLPPPNDHAHNTFAHAGAEGGLVVLAAVLVIVTVVLWRGWRTTPGWRRDVVLLGGAALVAHGQIDVLGGLLGTELLLAVLATLAAPAVRVRLSKPEGHSASE